MPVGPFGQTVPQPPQLRASVRTFTSQPFVAVRSQSEKFARHVNWHVPAVQALFALATPQHWSADAHAVPGALQQTNIVGSHVTPAVQHGIAVPSIARQESPVSAHAVQ